MNDAKQPDLDALLESARNHVMTDAEREAQRQSYARSCAVRGERQAVFVGRPPKLPMPDATLDGVIRAQVLGVLDQIETRFRQGGDVLTLIAHFRRDFSKEVP